MFHSLPPTGFGPRLVVNPDNLELLPETVARGQERPLKVTLLPGHRGLDADMGSLDTLQQNALGISVAVCPAFQWLLKDAVELAF
ncbi:tRNA-dihydrouridine(20) synthase [NAD(P)+]-like [Dissostichus eleginoides]|uniref:tRNA-dihydrouridine(20) synthase [NAD(P)+]-like n=1 Tax=Dissostichus eleginoides TaxID=100907 RepID=A0AAD9B5A9_DISEL|nr:tRNA-dihydrouridine(20) synthase [NAD(P)+]-like [Dissostichus eleginoides]